MIKVFIVDDSATVRQLLSSTLNSASGIEVIGVSSNPVIAWPRMLVDWPDVIVSDIEMPEMDGIEFLKKIMRERATPVVICSAHIESKLGSEEILRALGAANVISKPKVGIGRFIKSSHKNIIEVVRAAASLSSKKYTANSTNSLSIEEFIAENELTSVKAKRPPKTMGIVAIGCSTGGTQALEAILPILPLPTPPILIVQHMPNAFIPAFAKRLNGMSEISVKLAQQGEVLAASTAYLAPGDIHLSIKRFSDLYQVELKKGPPVNRHIPSVDVLFKSLALEAGHNVTSFLLTGMGKDGAKGMVELKAVGATTYAQNKDTSTVFGMPAAAVKLGGASYQIALNSIPAVIAKLS